MVGATSCCQVKVQTRILSVGKGIVFFAGAVRIVAVSLHPIRQLGPRRVKVEQWGVIDGIGTATANAQMQVVNRLAHAMYTKSAIPCSSKDLATQLLQIFNAILDHHAHFLAKERGEQNRRPACRSSTPRRNDQQMPSRPPQ